MKKYGMLILSLIIFLSTIFIYIYTNTNLPISSYKEPEINFKSKKFGDIKNIVWGKVGNYGDHLFILADNVPNGDKGISYIYYLNINTGKYGVLTSFETNKDFENFMDYIQWETLYTISKNGINSIAASINPATGNVDGGNSIYPISDFKNVDSISIGNQIYYTKSTDKLLYIQYMPSTGFTFSSFGSQSSTRTLYADVDKVISSPDWNNIYFIRRERSGVNAYKLERKSGIGGFKQTLVTRNFLYLRESAFLGGKFVTLMEEDKEFGILSDGKLIGRIAKNTDSLGQIPDVQLRAVNSLFEIFYTSFNENHIGSIYCTSSYAKPATEIVSNQPIIGPVRLSMSLVSSKLLFFTYENGKVHIKTCSTSGDDLTDITELIK